MGITSCYFKKTYINMTPRALPRFTSCHWAIELQPRFRVTSWVTWGPSKWPYHKWLKTWVVSYNPTSRAPIHSTYNWYPCRDVKLKMACQGNGRYFLGLKNLKSDHEWFFWLALRSSIGVIFVGVWILEIPVDKKMMEDFPRSIDAACVYRPTKESCTRSFVLDFY